MSPSQKLFNSCKENPISTTLMILITEHFIFAISYRTSFPPPEYLGITVVLVIVICFVGIRILPSEVNNRTPKESSN